jgi:hypothetical protein
LRGEDGASGLVRGLWAGTGWAGSRGTKRICSAHAFAIDRPRWFGVDLLPLRRHVRDLLHRTTLSFAVPRRVEPAHEGTHAPLSSAEAGLRNSGDRSACRVSAWGGDAALQHGCRMPARVGVRERRVQDLPDLRCHRGMRRGPVPSGELRRSTLPFASGVREWRMRRFCMSEHHLPFGTDLRGGHVLPDRLRQPDLSTWRNLLAR